MYEIIKKFLDEGGRCLLIENGEPIGVVLTMEEYDKIKSKPEAENKKPEKIELEINAKKDQKVNASNPIGEAVVNELNFSEASANIDEINLADAESVTLEDLGLDELPY